MAKRKSPVTVVRSKGERLREIRNIYEAAAAGRRTQHWRASSLDATSEIVPQGSKVRSVARDMVRNNAFAARAKALIVHNTVGAGIVPRIDGVSQKAKKLITRHFETTDIDADGRYNLYGLQALALGAIVESGEVLIRRRLRRASDGLGLPFQLQVLEPDYLDISRDGRTKEGGVIIGGIQFDAIGRREGYWLYPVHPGAVVGAQVSVPASSFVSADNVIHVYRVDRPGQMRGISWFAPVILRMRDFADFTDAQLVRQKIAACFAAFITTPEGYTGDKEAGETYPSESFEPGMIERLKEGETVTFATPPTTQDFSSYSDVTLREIAVGLGITPFALSGDLARVNFSAGRLGWLEFQRNIDAWRWLMLIPQMMDAIAKWTNDALALSTGSRTQAVFSWTPPRREMIDPSSEVASTRDQIRAGIISRPEAIRELGFDPEQIDAENAEANARADRLGLVYDSDARTTNLRGQLQGAPAAEQAQQSAPDPQQQNGAPADQQQPQ